MEIVTLNSETLFADFLELIQENPTAWMCVHINMSALNDEMFNTDGLSAKTFEKIHTISAMLARKMYEDNLKRAEGKIFIFEDGDILTLFSCHDLPNMQIVDKLRLEFSKQGLSNIYTCYQMHDKLASLIKLSKNKMQSADDFRRKKQAVISASSLLELVEVDTELKKEIQRQRQQREPISVLIIEDDLVTRGLIASGLKNEYLVLQAKDAKSGIASYIHNAPNVVLLDLHLPDHSGHEVLSAIKRIDPASYVVMLSADSLSTNVLGAQAKGSAGFIKKPFSKERIIEFIEKCPNGKPMPTGIAALAVNEVPQ